MWDAFVDAWAIAAGAVPAPPQPSEELLRAASILLGLPEADLMTRLDGAQTTRLRDVGGDRWAGLQALNVGGPSHVSVSPPPRPVPPLAALATRPAAATPPSAAPER
jgi:hypothetical protein